MFISDGIISLRIAEPEDAQQIYDWENNRDLWRVSETSNPISMFQIEQFLLGNSDLATNRQLRLMIGLAGVERAIGCLDLFDYQPIHSRVGLGILIEESYRGKGYATRAVTLCLCYLFNDVMVHQVHCLVDESNTASHHLFKSLGFSPAGTLCDWIKTPSGYLNAVFYQKIAQP